MDDARERKVIKGYYGDIPLGIFLVKSTNIVFVGLIVSLKF